MLGFLRRNQVLVSSGLLLLLAAMLVSANAGSTERVDPLGRFVLDAVYPLQKGLTELTGGVRGVWRRYVDLVDARRSADVLRERVETLEGELTRLVEVEAANQRLQQLLEFRPQIGQKVVTARVIGWAATTRDRTITVDRGARDGVGLGAAVLVPYGVVGRVFRVGRDAARVLLISDRNSGVDAVVQRTRLRGIIQGRGSDCNLKYVKRGSDVREGDRVVTSGLDGIFPKGMLLGEVVQVKAPKRGLFQSVIVEPRVDFDQLEEVLVETDEPLPPLAEPIPEESSAVAQSAGAEPRAEPSQESSDTPAAEPR